MHTSYAAPIWTKIMQPARFALARRRGKSVGPNGGGGGGGSIRWRGQRFGTSIVRTFDRWRTQSFDRTIIRRTNDWPTYV